MQDPVADMLTCIRNAQAMNIVKIQMPHSKLKFEILNVLKQEGYIVGADVVTDGNKNNIEVTLKY
jgi:small subunit ribosomal protein S8